VWYFVFGGKEKSSFCGQYALEHGMQHLANPSETTLKEHDKKPLIIEGTPELFRAVEKWKAELTAVFLPNSALSEGEAAISRDYEMIGRAEFVPANNYPSFRKELNPQIIIIYGPSEVLITSLLKTYLNFIGYIYLTGTYTAN
jgi:hypothetical protein